MRINKIQSNNQTGFGIKFINKSAWNKDVLQSFENSNLFKSLDKKYPNAEVYYMKMSGEDSIANSELIHTLLMDIKLEDNKIFRWTLSSHTENVPEKELAKSLKTMTIEDVDNYAKEDIRPIVKYDVRYRKNPLIEFFKKLFK